MLSLRVNCAWDAQCIRIGIMENDPGLSVAGNGKHLEGKHKNGTGLNDSCYVE
ncbi:MAG: hypothetical protein PHH97_04735 [Candidatus Cloacimonetes bacterium]|jgi:hypothetical protein|nr:hypothetical protein [Candidatus Cloacimonadota bacterium]MDD4676891.1 hypothetical protein [Candidatus Cloacimonadota bacterium]